MKVFLCPFVSESEYVYICCFAEFADIVTRLGKVSRIYSKIVPLFQRIDFDTQLNHLAGTSATEKILENAAVLLQYSKKLHKKMLQINFCNAFQCISIFSKSNSFSIF